MIDARAQLLRVAPELRVLGEQFSDSAWMPDEATGEAVIAAALRHTEAHGITAFCLPVPGTTPPLAVALGPLEKLNAAVTASVL